jgi:DNA-binding transcriptional regulator YiaG
MNKAQELAKNIKRARKELGLNGDSQQELLKRVREAFELSNEELAAALGVAEATLLAYLAPESARKHRTMPAADLLVLARVLDGGRKRKRK